MPHTMQIVVDSVYRKPRSQFREIMHLGGPINWLRMKAGINQMQQASLNLTVTAPGDLTPDSPAIHFLTGKKFWFQTIFCMVSLQKVSPVAIRFHVHDDGSFDDSLEKVIHLQVPGVVIHRKSDTDERLRKVLPESKYTYLNHKRKVYPHIRKLLDVHAGSTGYKVVADSDMLFFRTPVLLFDWLKNPDRPFYIPDKLNSYGFTSERIFSVLGQRIPEKVNVGLIGLDSGSIDWDQMERWATELERGTLGSYFLEQTLTAMYLAGKSCVIGPEADYIVMPTHKQVKQTEGVLHHYVDTSKPDYFIYAWKKIR